MTTEAWCGFILSTKPQGDTSLRITCFTREKGVITALCKGGRTPKKQALLQPFIPLWLHLNSRSSWTYVRQIEMHAAPYVLSNQTLLLGLYINELLTYLLQPQDAHEAVYDAYEQLLNAFDDLSRQSQEMSRNARHDVRSRRGAHLCEIFQHDQKIALEILLRRFEWLLITACGYAFSWSQDARTQQPIVKDQSYNFSLGEGFIEGTDFAGDWIIAMQQEDYAPPVLKMAKKIMRQMIDHLLQGKILRTRALYAAMAMQPAIPLSSIS